MGVIMASKIESWIRVGDEKYDDCLVGNRKGLEDLKVAIEKVLEREDGSVEMADYTDSDFISLVLADSEERVEPEKSSGMKALTSLLVFLVILWLLVLPVWGIYSFIRLFLK